MKYLTFSSCCDNLKCASCGCEILKSYYWKNNRFQIPIDHIINNIETQLKTKKIINLKIQNENYNSIIFVDKKNIEFVDIKSNNINELIGDLI